MTNRERDLYEEVVRLCGLMINSDNTPKQQEQILKAIKSTIDELHRVQKNLVNNRKNTRRYIP